MAKAIFGYDIVTPATLFGVLRDYIEFFPGFFMMLIEHDDTRHYVSDTLLDLHKIVIAPEGTVYPGDATPGTGSKKVRVEFNVAVATVTHDLVDNIDFSTGWCILTKGKFIVAYTGQVVKTTIVEPS